MMRKWMFDVLQPDCRASAVSRLFDRFVTLLILISVASVFVGTFDLPCEMQVCLDTFEKIASVIFSVEYVLRIWTAPLLWPELNPWRARLRYVCSWMALIDLVAILPFYLPMFLPSHFLGVRALRLVRLLRILKLNRYSDAMQTVMRAVSSKKNELLGSLFVIGLLLVISSLLMYSVEHEVQPTVFKNAFSGLWWAFATITTVGYGDIYPVTVVGRIFGAMIAFFGVAAFAIPTGVITSGLLESVAHPADKAEPARGKSQDEEEEPESAYRRKQDAERDALLKEQGELLKRIAAELARLQKSSLN